MKSDRLLSLLLLLQTRGLVPATELAERLEVSVRTIYRDVEALSASGVPVYAERGRHGGITLLPGFRTDVTGLTADESRALFVLAAQGAHAALGLDRALGSALRKVMAALPEPHRPAAELTSRRILVDPDRWMRTPRPAVDLDVLDRAVLADRRVRLQYRSGGAPAPKTYTVDPYGLVVKAGVWYLVADRDAEPRLFRADRVHRAELLDDPVRRRDGIELADVWEVLRRRVETRPDEILVRARVHRERLDRFVRLHGDRLTAAPERSDPDEEWTEVELAFHRAGDARPLLAMGGSLEVLDPPEIRTLLARAAAEIVALYPEARDADAGAGPEAQVEPRARTRATALQEAITEAITEAIPEPRGGGADGPGGGGARPPS
ncbi:WYL domain-containing protein [Streptomyces sp. NPDC047981]|uniref:helix-turn-helix transcriptional regulator n=1 Tax=Streptomyces sp. NPDC047981 TaxID=3154610 RepID=UPI00341CFE18